MEVVNDHYYCFETLFTKLLELQYNQTLVPSMSTVTLRGPTVEESKDGKEWCIS